MFFLAGRRYCPAAAGRNGPRGAGRLHHCRQRQRPDGAKEAALPRPQKGRHRRLSRQDARPQNRAQRQKRRGDGGEKAADLATQKEQNPRPVSRVHPGMELPRGDTIFSDSHWGFLIWIRLSTLLRIRI
jgi:hypothetical protein